MSKRNLFSRHVPNPQEQRNFQSLEPDKRPTRQELLATIVEDSSDAILANTLDGTVVSWNHAAERMYGYTTQEIIGRSCETLLPREQSGEAKQILSRLKREKRTLHFETTHIAKNGRKLNVTLTISPIRDEGGCLVGAFAIGRDVTQAKKTEEALLRAESLATVGRMVTTIAHEINNPLETIGNILYLLRNSVPNADALKYVDTAQEELKRVSEITRVTLAHQRGSSSRAEPVTISKLLDNVLALQSLNTGGLTVHAQRRYRTDGLVIASRGELRQVFSNLILNAMDALAMSGNTLILGVRAARDVLTGQNGVRVTVLDNGPGIAPEHRSQLFEAFYTTKGEKGTGIGLWVTKNIVAQHGGTIRMRSCVRPGRSGTCFSIFLPLERDRGAN